ncbi:MAG: NRDE family protein [Pseudomonadota bacterium]
MCLIVFAWKVIPGVHLVAAANRDEFYARAAAPAAPWPEHPHIFAGRDLKAGGSWMGIRTDSGPRGRFAAITNIRAPGERRAEAPSRGALVANYLAGSLSPRDYVAALIADNAPYNGYNLVLGDRDTLIWYSNRGQDDVRNGQPLPPGIYGISNALLDAPWPKVIRTKAQFASLLCQSAPDAAYFDMLADTTRAPDSRLPETGVPLDLERVLSAVCIESPEYGTRTSTVVKLYANAPGELHEVLLR